MATRVVPYPDSKNLEKIPGVLAEGMRWATTTTFNWCFTEVAVSAQSQMTTHTTPVHPTSKTVIKNTAGKVPSTLRELWSSGSWSHLSRKKPNGLESAQVCPVILTGGV